MTLDREDIEAIAEAVERRLGALGGPEIKADEACRMLGVGRRALFELTRKYPEIQPFGKGTHKFDRKAVARLAWIRKAER